MKTIRMLRKIVQTLAQDPGGLRRLAGEVGDVEAQRDLGFMYSAGQDVPQDHAEAAKWYRLAAEQGDGFAQLNLGDMYKLGRGVPQDYPEAAKWYRLAAGHGYVSARDFVDDYDEAAKWRGLATIQGDDAEVQYNLGVMYHHGKGVPPYYAKAAKWYRLAAEQGHVDAQYNLAVMYGRGIRAPGDYTGVPEGYTGHPDDIIHSFEDCQEYAAKWFRLAAEQGHVSAQAVLGEMYESGRGVPQDYSEAAKWHHLAAEQGHAVAQSRLGHMYFVGHGVPKDNVQAHMWTNLAAAAMPESLERELSEQWVKLHDPSELCEDLVQFRDVIADMLSAEDLARAQALARNWKSRHD